MAIDFGIRILKKLRHYIKPSTKIIYQRNSYSQAGEDVVVDFLLRGVGLLKPSYLELGVFYPDVASNTYKFYLRGARGVLVEADRTQLKRIIDLRPEDKVLNVGVGKDNGHADFYVFNIGGLNTFSKAEAEQRTLNKKYWVTEIIEVPIKNINDIISENFDKYPDFLSIDIEGYDLEVLKTLDYSNYPIPIICAETCTFSENHIKSKDNSIAEFLSTKGYFIYADTYINTIFVNKSWFTSIKI